MHLHPKKDELPISRKHIEYQQKVVGCKIDNVETGYRSMKEIPALDKERNKQYPRKSYERYIDKQPITKQKNKKQKKLKKEKQNKKRNKN